MADTNLEIERKFLVKGDFKSLAQSYTHIIQGYLCRDSGRTVRIRLRDEKAFLTIKGPSSRDGLSRIEWEREISSESAKEMLQLCLPGVIDKYRYIIPFSNHIFEVDEFLGENKGLILAEVELQESEKDSAIPLPSFIGKEVTGDLRYYNSQLSLHPYSSWG